MPKANEIIEAADQGSQPLTEDTIRMRAYELYQQRGCEEGHDLDDWLQAEAEVTGKKFSARADKRKSLHKVAAG